MGLGRTSLQTFTEIVYWLWMSHAVTRYSERFSKGDANETRENETKETNVAYASDYYLLLVWLVKAM